MTSGFPKAPSTSTVGRGKAITLTRPSDVDAWADRLVSVSRSDSLNFYSRWERPATIISDGAYGVLGFEGDTSDHIDMPERFT